MQKYLAADIHPLQQEERPFQIKMVERIPIKSPIKRFIKMSNTPVSGMAHISEDTGFYMVGPQESVIFYSKGPGEQKKLFTSQLTH
jgi:hypothetical protein